MISAAEWNAIAEEAKKAGVDRFLSKPLFPSAIAEIINDCIGADEGSEKESPVNIIDIFAGHRILLVEDMEINREIVMAMLELTQLGIDCAENGTQAVRMFSEAPDKYDLIFMDIQMPEMDGYEATRLIRAVEAELKEKAAMEFPKETPTLLSERPEGVPIIAMTANVFREDIEKCIDAGMNSHIGKPIDFEEVVEKLKSYLKPFPKLG
jgi:CheY-like chemotaxis protein